VQRLIDTAVMIETVIVPSLGPQFRQKALHGWFLEILLQKSAMKQI
jgi:hypothetical protein